MSLCVQPCLLCDAPVELPVTEWVAKEAAFVLCSDCGSYVKAGLMSWPLVKMLYLMRCQIGTIFQRVDQMDRQLKELAKTQQELDQELLGKRRAA